MYVYNLHEKELTTGDLGLEYISISMYMYVCIYVLGISIL